MDTRTFRLSSYDISPSNNLADYYKQTVTTQYGKVADNRMSLTWNNVNLQQIVGDDFYNAYNRFTIRLVNHAWFGAPTSGSGATLNPQIYQDSFVNVYLTGLPFYPPVYNSPNGALVNTLTYGTISTTTGGTSGSNVAINSVRLSFLKTSSVNLSVNIRCVATEQPYSPGDISTYVWGHSQYYFEITGVPDAPLITYDDLTNSSLLSSGSHTIYTELTPTDPTNYFASSNVTNISVSAYSTSISFAPSRPTSIVYETNLTAVLITNVGITSGGITPEGTTRYYLDSVFTQEITTASVLNYGSYTIYALFTPTSADYANSSASTSLIVTQKSSTLTYASLPSIVYGTTMESSLTATCTAPGTITYYYDASYTQVVNIADVKNAGTYTIYAKYTSDANNYTPSTASSLLTVTVAPTTLTFGPLAAITYPTTIAASLSASASSAGTINYYLDSAYTQLVASTDVFNAGSYTLYALFTPSSSNYSSSAASAGIVVNKYAPTITLPTIASFVYGTTLSDFIAGTTVDISAGTLSFYVGNETGTLLTSSSVLHVGSYTIFCKFTPTNTNNYLVATSTAALTVTTQSTTIAFSESIPISFQYETTLANVLVTTASVAGTINYYYISNGSAVAVTASTVLSVGTYTLYAQLIPTNTDYASSTASTVLTVTFKTPTVNYSNLPSITYRTTASSSLNATVSPSIAGSFRYFLNVDQTGEILSSTVLNAGTYTIYAYFTPSNNNYTSEFASTTLTVNKFQPVLDFGSSSIVYGTQIAGSLNATVELSIPGTIAYYLDSGFTQAVATTDVFEVGTYTLYALFTPTNSSNYETATVSETVTVTKQPTTLTFPSISSFVYETTLANFIAGTTVANGVAGAFHFYLNNLSGTVLSSSTVLETGVYTIFCQFIPTDTANYSSTSGTKSLTVTVLATTIVFASSIPSSIVYGTTLSQVVNTVVTPSVGGTVRYYTNSSYTNEVFSSTVLDVANYTLYAVFTPEMDDYSPSSTSTQLSVTKATTTVTYPTLSSIAYGTTMSSSFTAYVSPSMQGVFNYYYFSAFFVNGTNKVSLSSTTVLNSGTYTIYANFVPSSSNYSGSTSSQTLTVNATPTTVIYNNLPNIAYATTLASSLNATIYPNISGTMKYYIDTEQVFPTTLLEIGTYSIRATFTPTSNNYMTSTTTKSLTVTKISPTIVFPSVSSIVYQTTLADFISGTNVGGVPGTFVFRRTDANGDELLSTTVLAVGSYTIFCTFQPTDTAHYSAVESTKSLVVTGMPTSLAYSPSIASSIAYETTLADILSTVASPAIAGTTVYKVGTTVVTGSSVLDAGTYVITATFTPTDTDYAESTATTTLVVTALPTTLSFSIASSIVYGTSLNSSLTATCAKPGTIAYYYDSAHTSVATGNDVPDTGSYTLYAVFTPSTANYVSSTASASLTVVQRTTTLSFAPSVPTVLTYETTLSAILSSTVSPTVSGTTAYYYLTTDSSRVDVSSTTVLSVGSYTIRADFTPSSGNYTTSTATISLLVSQKPILVTYSGLSAITYGQTLSTSLVATLSQTVDGTLSYYSDSALTTAVTSSTVLNAGNYTIYAKFTPTSGNYVSYAVNTGLTVNKATPAVTYGTLSPILYGVTLQSSFTATASVDGTIAYYLLNDLLSSSQILNAGTYTIKAQFTPTDTTNYNSAFATSTLQVQQKSATLSFSTSTSLTYGTTLASFISGTTATVAGTFLFYLADSTLLTSSSVLNAGNYTVYCTFSPTDTTNYIQVVSSTSVTVAKLETTITLSTISTINSENKIAAFISGTTASVVGTFSFYLNNASGQVITSSTVLSAGTRIIYVLFTPTNSTNYLSSNTTKTVTVQSETATATELSDPFDVTKVMDNMSFWIDSKSSTKFGFDEAKQTWSDNVTKVATHVAVGSGTQNTIAYSYDGVNWTGLGKSIFSNSGNCVATNGSIWLAGGAGTNTAAYSFDGINWTAIPTPGITTRTNGFAYGRDGSTNNMWVAVGTNSVATSFDGVNWINRGAKFSVGGNAVAWNGSSWVAVGQTTNKIMTSTNGIDWIGSGATVFSTAGYGIACNSSMWVAVGQGTNTIAYSFNGTSWTGVTSSPFTTAGYGVAWNGTMWVAVGSGGNSIAYSFNGIEWTGVTALTVFSTNGSSIAWNGTQWIAGGQGTNTIATSSDGITWTARGSSVFSASVTGMTGYKTTNEIAVSSTLGKHLLTGSGTNSLGFTSTGSSFNGLTRLTTFSTQGNAVNYDPVSSKWVAVGQGGNTIATSSDGFSWTGCGATTFTTAGTDVIYDGSKWIAAGQGGNMLATSSDGGTTWSGQNLSYFTGANSVNYASPLNATTSTTTYDASLNPSTVTVSCPSYVATGKRLPVWVAVGSGTVNSIAISTDGITWTGLGKTIFSSSASKVAYANGLWVAVGTGTNNIATSTDGFAWTGRNTTAFYGGVKGIAYGNGLWVVVAASGGNAVATSSDGITWTGGSLTSTNNGYCVAYGNGLWVVGSSDPYYSIQTSTNGISWTVRSSLFSTSCNAVAYGNGIWVAVGSGTTNTIATSTDGITWTGRGKTIFITQGLGVAYGNGRWVALGLGGNSIATSTDGITWTGLGTTVFTIAGYSASYANGLWTAVGRGGNTFATSTDGITWTGRGSTDILTEGWGVAAVDVPAVSLAVSTNGTSWTPIGQTPGGYGTNVFGSQANYVYGISGSYVAVGQGGNSIASSDDGINWTGRGSTVFTTSGNGVYSNGSIWVAVGEGGNTIATSTDRITWTGRGVTVFTTRGNKVVYNANLGLWIATGQGANTVATSVDGITWTGLGTSMFSTAGYGIARSGPVGSTSLIQGAIAEKTSENKLFFYVSVGSGGNTISYSPDGKAWTGLNTSPFNTKGNKIAHNGAMYIAVGQGTNNTLAYSYEGVKFTGLGTNMFTTAGYGIASNSYMWVAVGQGGNTLATSTNGVTWNGSSTPFTTAGYNVIWANNQWVAVGEGGNTIATSTNGLSWTGRETGVVFTKARGIAYGANIWVAVGEGTNTIATSTDNGITWTGCGKTTFTTAANNVAWNGSRFVAVGQGGNTVATSIDGSVWSAVTGTRFATYGSDIKWVNNSWLATGSDTTNFYLGSVDGLIWTGLGKGSNTTEVNGIGGFAYVNKVKYLVTEGATNIAYSSYDGVNWIRQVLPGSRCKSLRYINNIWVVADNSGVIYSSDAFNWTVSSTGFTTESIKYGNNLWVAFGSSGQLSTSPNLVTWTTRTSPFSTRSNDLYWNGSMWVAAGFGTSHTLAMSTDGITWTGMGKTVFTTQGLAVIYANNLWVAGGSGGNALATSTDGINWTPRATSILMSSSGYSIGWNGSLFVATTINPQIITSPDGINWTSRGSFLPDVPMSVVWSGSYWIAGSQSGYYLFFSNDGITWSTKTFASRVYSIAMNPNVNYPSVTKAFDKSTLNNNSTLIVDEFSASFPTGHLLKENVINKNPALQLIRSGFVAPYSPAYTGNTFSFFSVIKFNMMYSSPRFLSFGTGSTTNDGSSSSGFMVSGTQTSAVDYEIALWRNNVKFTISNIVLGTPYLISGYFDGFSVNVGLNGTYTKYDCSGSFSIQKVGIGINTFDNSGTTHTTDFGEILTFATLPTSAQRQKVEAYLAQKWGLSSSLPSNHLYKQSLDTFSPVYIPQSNNSGYAGRILQTNPMVYYTMEETGTKLGNYATVEKFANGTYSSFPIYDASISAGTIVVSSSDYKFGAKSLQFPGTAHTGSVTLSPQTFSNGNAITISAWVKFASLDAVPRTVISLTNSTDSITLAATANNYLVYRKDISYNVPIIPATNTWTHIVASNPNIGTNTWTVTVNKLANTSNMNITSTTNNIYTKSAIGMDASSNTQKMDGFIDDVRIFNSTLSTAQISQLYDGKFDINALVSHYTFDTVTGNSFANFASGSVVYDASITDISLQTNVGNRLGIGCLTFPSVNSTGSITLGQVDLTADPSNATISTWAKFSSLDTTPRTVFSLKSATNKSITLSATYQNYSFVYKTSTTTNIVNLPGTNLNTWNHIAVEVNNDSTNTWILYLNGTKTTFTTDSASGLALPAVDFGSIFTTNTIGVDGSINRMHGFIDDTRIYNKGLTDAEVLGVFNTDFVFTTETIKNLNIGGPVSTTINMAPIDTITYGTTLSAFISGTTASAAGTLSFFINDASGEVLTSSTVLNAGTYNIYCELAPTDAAAFLPASAIKQLVVDKVATTVTLPASINTFTYGTTMAAFISGTTTSVVGTKSFYVNDPSGQLLVSSTALTVGTYTIYCKFDPSSSNYAPSFATKQLIVTQKQITVTYGPLTAITYGTKLTSKLTASFNPATDGSMNYYIAGVPVSSTTVLDASSHVITATFTPASSNYLAGSATATLVVNKATTTVTYPTLQSVFFNAPIGSASLSATVTPTIDGTMAYFTNSTFTNQVFATTTLAQGTYTLYARFTPTSSNYSVSSASSSLLVKGITTPTITFPNMGTIAAYTTLESFINGTTAGGVDGTFVFKKNDTNGEVLTATSTFNTLGSFVVFCSFSPTNTDLYLPATATYTATVKFTPSFLFNQRPSSTITYGTNLSGAVLATTVGQFNNASIPGTVTFSNGISTASILTPGIYTVTATFTPTSLSEYNAVTTTKQILVNKQQITVMITSPSVKAALIKSTPIDCSYQIFGLVPGIGDTFENSVSGTIVNKYMTSDESQVLTAQYVYNTTFSGASQTYKIAADILNFSSTKYTFTSQSYTFTINKITPTISYTIASGNKTLTYGTKLGANQLNAVVTFNGAPVTSGSIVYTRSAFNMSQTVDSQTALDVGQHNLYAYYSDSVGNIYNSVNTSAVFANQITIVKATPTVYFPNIKSILAGTDLISLLDYTFASHNSNIIDGTFEFSYVNQSGASVTINALTILTTPPSSYTIFASFFPTDATRYNNTSGSTTLIISDQPTTTSATAKLQTPFVYGKNFNDLYTISVSPSISGTYAYYDDVIDFDPTSIIDAGTYTGYTVVFNPTSTVYASSLVNVTFTIEKADITLSYPTSPTFAYLTPNSFNLVQPTMTPAVDGQMQIFLDSSYTNEFTKDSILEIGTHTLYARFTPTKNYNVATATITVTVTKIPTSLSLATQTTSITYGNTIGPSLSNSVVDGIEGTIGYFYDASYTQVVGPTDILNFGTHVIYTKFEPTDAVYANSYATHTFNVAKTTMSITFPALASITYGETLASSFTATSTIDGSMNYYINSVQVFANTQLNAGTYTVQAVFTPTNGMNYSTATASASRPLTVAKQATVITYAPTNIISGATLAASMTATVTPNIDGAFRYFNSNTEIFSTTVLSAGNYSIYVTFTPTNLTNYTSSSMTAPFAVITPIQNTITTENVQQIQSAVNNQVVSIVTQNELLPPTLDVKVNILPAGETTFVSTSTSSTVSNVQLTLLDGSMNSSLRIVVSALTLNLPTKSNSPAIFFKIYDETGTSVVNPNMRVATIVSIPQFKGLTQYLYLLRLQDVGGDFDGTKIPLTSVNPTDSQNIQFSAVFTSNSFYVAALQQPASNPSEGVMVSNMYTFNAVGGFVMERGFDDIAFREDAAIETYDVTDSVQVLFDVATFNTKLGITKNTANTQLVSTQFNPVTDQFESNNVAIDTVTLSSTEFVNGLVKPEQIISVGRYTTLYSDFTNYVATYFGFDGGFSSLFTAASEFSIDDDGVFDSNSMLSLLTGTTGDGTGAYISDLSGQITIVNITKSLRHAVNTNCFGNRNPSNGGTAVDPANSSNYGVADGFVAGDLVWVNTGTLVKLNLNIDTEGFNPVNNVGPQNTLLQVTNYTSGNFSRETTATTTNINRSVRAPLLLKLVNKSTIDAL
jgi:hypothetical protein